MGSTFMQTRSSAASPQRSTDKPCLKEHDDAKNQLGIRYILQIGNDVKIVYVNDKSSKFKENWPQIRNNFLHDPLHNSIEKTWQSLCNGSVKEYEKFDELENKNDQNQVVSSNESPENLINQHARNELHTNSSSTNVSSSDDENTFKLDTPPSPASSQELEDNTKNFQVNNSFSSNHSTSTNILYRIFECIFGEREEAEGLEKYRTKMLK
jgi:hypothetical protein